MSNTVKTQIKNAFTSAKNLICRRVDVVDNLTSSSTDLPLSANMGKELKDSILDLTYPVGAIYMSVVNTDPGTLFGGTWKRWAVGRTPVGVDENDSTFSSTEKTGGEKDHELLLTEMPSHSHGLNGHVHSVGAHAHGLNGHAHSINAISIGSSTNEGEHYHAIKTIYTKDMATTSSGKPRFTQNGSYVNNNSDSITCVSAGAHTHSLTVPAHNTNGASGNTANSAAFNTGGNSGNTTNSGTGGTHNNLQPYITCYMWKRVS